MEKITYRTVSWFSCGAASAYATHLAITATGGEAVYCRVRQEHEDNLRFMDDFSRVTGIPVKIITNEQFDGDIISVFLKRGFIKNQYGAPCTMILKKDMRKAYQLPTDIQVFGYTVEEQDRIDRFIDSNNEVNAVFPLLDNKITKQDCYAFIKQLGIKLPVMYQLGYTNNNCIGCVKGGMGYWNKIRVDFPEQFNRMALLERYIGHAINKEGPKLKNKPVFLDELSPTRGRKTLTKDMPTDCGFTCESTK
jgi:3'-phosphoadenosine 5'-phosphosulfate sulfotransferase (PAPS reductase)/FAD synthetase